MKKSKIKGYAAFALLSDLDDTMIAAAALPEEDGILTGKQSRKNRENAEPSAFARFMDSNWAAAVISVTVALAVLMGVVAAGRMAPEAPNGIEGPIDGTNQNVAGGVPGDSDVLLENESNIHVNPVNPDFELMPDDETTPVSDVPTESPKGAVAVTSDGKTVYPEGYCVWASGQQLDGNGELTGFDADGPGAVDQLGDIWDRLPTLQTSGNDFDLVLPDNMTLRSARIFEMVEIQTKTLREIDYSADGPDVSVDPMGYLSTLRGYYTVVLEIYHETIYSEDEYTKGVDEYAFKLNVDPTINAPVSITHNGRTYSPEKYTLQKSYYDAELGRDVVTDYDGAEKVLKTLVKGMQTVTVTRGEELSLYLAPFYELKSIKVYRGLKLWEEYDREEPLELLSEWDADDYYFIITAVFNGTGETEVAEFPIRINLLDNGVEQPPVIDTSSYPVIETLVLNNGYMLWTEEWHDGGMITGDSFGAEGQLSDLVAEGELDRYRLRHPYCTPFKFTLVDDEAPLDWVVVYDMSLNRLGEAKNFTVLHELPAGEYIVILTVTMQGDYIPEADAYEATCYEYPFILEVYNP